MADGLTASRRVCVAFGLEVARVCAESHVVPSFLIKDVILSNAEHDKKMTMKSAEILLERMKEMKNDRIEVIISIGEALGIYRLENILYDIYGGESYSLAKTVATKAEIQKYGAESPASALTYGELGSESFIKIFRQARYRLETTGDCLTFYDLGSGRGVNVFLAALAACDCNVLSLGIEILPGLHAMAQAAATSFHYYTQHSVEFILGDLTSPTLAKQWIKGDIIFANWICFDQQLSLKLIQIAENMMTGSILVTFTTAAQSMHFIVIDKFFFPHLPWGGPCTVYIHRKLSPAQHAARLAGKLPPSPYDADQALSIPQDDDSHDDDEDMDSLENNCPNSGGDSSSLFVDELDD
mmetsp:Transcript_2231/g.2941  ORF Transcript_2231/g.2941 Transcript_2231/m.2941 type:complete len:354 (-) Transcript_2231:1352-2413(-)